MDDERFKTIQNDREKRIQEMYAERELMDAQHEIAARRDEYLQAAFIRIAEADAKIANARAVTAEARAVTAKVRAVTAKSNARIADARAVTAKVRAVSAKVRADDAKVRADEAKVRANEAKVRANDAKVRADDAKHRFNFDLLSHVAYLVKNGENIAQICEATGADKETISIIAQFFKYDNP
ncbi:MAG: hypothetical protein LBR53_01595 [Deltaproteobacteria bacterium]|nr:hypothetical protein [Deltaproteobacteria bacterium]